MSEGISQWHSVTPAKLMLAALTIVIGMQIELAFTKSINWDEFFHFSQVHRHLQGRPTQWLQLPFVWLFSWVPSLSGDIISHIQLIRALLLPFELVTIGAIIASSRHLAGREEALLCALLYVTGGYVFLHAFALRADMIAAALLTTALWIGICRPLRALEIASAAALLLLAFLATIKTVLYAPAFFGVAWFRLQKRSHRVALAVAGVLALAAAAVLLWAAPHLPRTGMFSGIRDIGWLGREAVARMFSAGLFPQPQWLGGQILRAPLLTAAIVLALLTFLRRELPTAERVLGLSLLLPLCSVAFYRNAYPYYFVFILPPAMIAVAMTIRPIVQRYGVISPAMLLLAIAVTLSILENREVIDRQRTFQAGVREIFPTPVTYIDDCGVLSNFPRAINHYASGWALSSYRRASIPTYSMAMEAEPVPLFLADDGPVGSVCFDILHRGALFYTDYKSIKDNYVQHWGKVFVAGKHIEAGEQEVSFKIAVPGTYTVEGGPVVIDRISYSAGNVVELARGEHTASGNRPVEVTLRWGDHLPRPAYTWPHEPLFTEF